MSRKLNLAIDKEARFVASASKRVRALALAAGVIAASAAHADSRNTIIDFGAGGATAGYLPGSAAARAPAQAAQQTPVPVAATVAPAQAYAPAPAASSYSAPTRQPVVSAPASQYDVSPTSVNGYTVAPTSIEGYANPPVGGERRQVAELYAPQPLPPRLGGGASVPAPAQHYLAPAPARPAVVTKYGRKAQAKRVAKPKQAAEEPAVEENEEKKDEPENPKHAAVDVSIGATTRKATTMSVGGTVAIGGHLEESGARLHVASQVQFGCCIGAFKNSTTTRSTTYASSALVGYEVTGEKGSVAGYVGVNVENFHVAGNEEALIPATRATAAGFQVAADLYWTPTDKIMLSSNASFSTRKYAYFMRSKLGVAVAEEVYVGPEVGLQGSKDYRQYRVGAHLSGVKLGAMSFGFALGYAFDRKNGNGLYAILDSRVTF
jgi:hypothetical protein